MGLVTKRRKVIVHIGASADGYIARPDGDLEWLTARPAPKGFYGMDAFVKSIDTMVLGRKTYDIMAAYWPTAPEDAGGEVFNDAPKYVASRGRPTLEWSNSVLIEGDAADGLAALKAEDGPELQVHGSSNLIQTLLRHNLVDEYRLWVFPVVLGSGKRLFSDGAIPAGLKLLDSKVSTTGVVIGTYEPAGEIVTGSF